jgi:DNA-binding transcriptional regulator GbsR (MarR family)
MQAKMAPKRQPSSPALDPAALDASSVDDAQAQVADIFADISEFWGFTRTQGRVFGLIFMSPEPLDHRTVRERLGISAGSASMTLTSLVDWGVLHRDGRLYVAETNFWKLITSVLRQREGDLINDSIARAEHVAKALRASPDDARTRFARKRITHLLEFFEMGRSLFEALLERNAVRGILNTMMRRSASLRPSPFPKRADDARLDV